jgi:hypothetical protein
MRRDGASEYSREIPSEITWSGSGVRFPTVAAQHISSLFFSIWQTLALVFPKSTIQLKSKAQPGERIRPAGGISTGFALMIGRT